MYSEKVKLHKRQREYKNGMLRTVSFDVTPKCNMNCSHCYAMTFSKVKPIETKFFQKVFDEAYSLGVHHYILQGGEPIIDKERLKLILSSIYPDETYINVVSNGWDMTRDNVCWLKDLKVDKIAFSLDSGIEQEHDSRRGKGSFHRVMRAIDDVLKEGLLTSISTVVTHQSLHSCGFEAALKFAGLKGIRIDVQIAMPVGRWDGRKKYLITRQDAIYIKKLRTGFGTLPNGQYLINRDVYNFGGSDHCPAGIEFMAVTADGNVLPCNFCQFTLGNIKDKSFGDMRRDLIKSRWFNGSFPRCLVGEDREFIDKYIMTYRNYDKPLDAYEIFEL